MVNMILFHWVLMDSLVEKEKMRILATGLIKGFTILEILIVLAIISIPGTFYLILNQPKSFDIYEQTFNEYQTLSIYSGNSYAFTPNSIKILNKDIWEDLEVADFSAIYSVTNNLNKTIIIEEDDIFLVISPGKISIKSLTLSGGKTLNSNISRGFSLLEVVIALLIISITFLAYNQLIEQNLKSQELKQIFIQESDKN